MSSDGTDSPSQEDGLQEIVEDERPQGISAASGPRLSDAEPPHSHRLVLAVLLLIATLFANAIFVVVALLARAEVWDRFDSLAGLILAPLNTLLSITFGWYFATRSGR